MGFKLMVRKTLKPIYYARAEEIGPSIATQDSAGNKLKDSILERRICSCDNPHHYGTSAALRMSFLVSEMVSASWTSFNCSARGFLHS